MLEDLGGSSMLINHHITEQFNSTHSMMYTRVA